MPTWYLWSQPALALKPWIWAVGLHTHWPSSSTFHWRRIFLHLFHWQETRRLRCQLLVTLGCLLRGVSFSKNQHCLKEDYHEQRSTLALFYDQHWTLTLFSKSCPFLLCHSTIFSSTVYCLNLQHTAVLTLYIKMIVRGTGTWNLFTSIYLYTYADKILLIWLANKVADLCEDTGKLCVLLAKGWALVPA